MANLFMDSVRHLGANDLALKYDAVRVTYYGGPTVQPTGGRGNGPCITMEAGLYVVKYLGGYVPAVFAGARWAYISGSTRPITGQNAPYPGVYNVLALYDGATMLVGVFVDSGGKLYVTNGSAYLGDSGGKLVPTAGSAYIELGATIDPASGTVTVQVDGETYVQLTGVNTAPAGPTPGASAVAFGNNRADGNPAHATFCDIYINDNTGADNNGFWGDVAIECATVTTEAAGCQSVIGGAAPAATRVASVGEPAPDGDAAYLSYANAGDGDFFGVDPALAFGTHPAGAPVLAVAVNAVVRKDAAGTPKGAPSIRSNGNVATGPAQTPGVTYGVQQAIFARDPNGNGSLSLTALRAMQYGYTRAS